MSIINLSLVNQLHWHLKHFTCKPIATLTLQPKDVLTARAESPRLRKSLEKEFVSAILGLSSATITQVRTADKLIPLACKTNDAQKSMTEALPKHATCNKINQLPIPHMHNSMWALLGQEV